MLFIFEELSKSVDIRMLFHKNSEYGSITYKANHTGDPDIA